MVPVDDDGSFHQIRNLLVMPLPSQFSLSLELVMAENKSF